MARTSALLKKKTKVKKSDYVVELDMSGWENQFSISKEHFVKAFYDDDDDAGWMENDEIITASLYTEETCCGFNVIGSWETYAAHIKDHDWEALGKMMGKELKKKKVVYLASYLPDTEEYAHVRVMLEAAGFLQGISLKTKHGGKYTNTRWEYLGDDPVEKTVLSRSV
jgi:hypothetical protein